MITNPLSRMYWQLAGVDPDDQRAVEREKRELGQLALALVGVVLLAGLVLLWTAAVLGS